MRGLNYRVTRNVLHTNSSGMTLAYIFRPSEEEFPPNFDSVMIAKLGAEFCIPVTENTSRAETLTRMADMEFQRARQIDAQQDSPVQIEDFSLIKARE